MDPDFLMTLMLEDYPAAHYDNHTTMTFAQSRSEFSFWALWASPLVLATDPRAMSAQKRSIVLNAEIIAVNQDALMVGGSRLANFSDGGQVWAKPLASGDMAVVLYNMGDDSAWGGGGPAVAVTVTWAMLGWDADAGAGEGVSGRDLWLHKDFAPSSPTSGHTATLEPQAVEMFVFSDPAQRAKAKSAAAMIATV
jgi:alpha-galactosidase